MMARFHPLLIVVLLLGAAVALSAPVVAAEELPLLTTSTEIRQLSPEQAALRYPVRLAAVVTYCNADNTMFFVQDAAAGICCLPATPGLAKPLHPGLQVILDAFTDPGGFAPTLYVDKITVQGSVPLPLARPMKVNDLLSGQQAGLRVEVRGLVRAVYPQGPDVFVVQLVSDGVRLAAIIVGQPPPEARQWVDGVVRIQGICSSLFNKQRQLFGVRLKASGAADVILDEPAPAEPFASAARPILSLMQFRPDAIHGRRVKVSGTVVMHQPDHSFYIEDGTGGLHVFSRDTQELVPGDTVDVIGFAAWGEYSPRLEDASFRRTGHGAVPAAVPITADQLLEGRHDGRLVRVQAQLVEHFQRPDGHLLVMKAGALLFHVRVASSDEHLLSLGNDSLLWLTGICRVQVDERWSGVESWRAPSFELELRSSADVQVLQSPPWWTVQRAAWLLAGCSTLLVGAIGWVLMLRHRVRQQTATIAQRLQAEAEAGERTRIARELHDTVEQDLAAVALHLGVIADHCVFTDSDMRENLDAAVQQVRRSQADAHQAVWDLRSTTLVEQGLASALDEKLNAAAARCGAACECMLEGSPRRLPGVVEHHMLRIGQEAISNAVRHGRPRRITVTLAYQPSAVTLQVSDDGHGFDVAAATGANAHRFGLLGMRERAAKIAARLSVQSSPGKGALVSIELPLLN